MIKYLNGRQLWEHDKKRYFTTQIKIQNTYNKPDKYIDIFYPHKMKQEYFIVLNNFS